MNLRVHWVGPKLRLGSNWARVQARPGPKPGPGPSRAKPGPGPSRAQVQAGPGSKPGLGFKPGQAQAGSGPSWAGTGLGPSRKTSIFQRKMIDFYTTTARRQSGVPAARKDNSTPTEDLHNNNPSLAALRKNKISGNSRRPLLQIA